MVDLSSSFFVNVYQTGYPIKQENILCSDRIPGVPIAVSTRGVLLDLDSVVVDLTIDGEYDPSQDVQLS